MGKNMMVGDFNTCKEAADQFYNVAKWCIDRDSVEYLIDTFYPYAVNVAFSCELYMKAIMIFKSPTNEFLKGHDLKELFDNLDENDKKIIANNFLEKTNNITIEGFLDKNKDVFIEWRYALERKVEINITGFEIFSTILHDYVNNLGGTNT